MNKINQFSATGKSGNPCERLMAPCSMAIFDMTLKMEMPISGRRDLIFKTSKFKELKLIT